METQAAGRSSSPSRTPDLGSGLIVACSLVLAATVVVGRGVAPVAAMLIVLSALVAWHRSDPCVARLALLRRRDRAVRPGRTVLTGDRAAVRLGSLPARGRARLARVAGLAARRPEGSPSAYTAGWAGRAHRRCVSRLRRRQLRTCGASRVGSSQGSHRLPFLHHPVSTSSPASSRPLPALSRSRSSSCAGVAVVAFFAIVEQRTGFNIFDHVRSVFRFCNSTGR